MKRWMVIGLAFSVVFAAQIPYSYSAYKTQLGKLTANKKPQKVLSYEILGKQIPAQCSGGSKKLQEASNKVGKVSTPPLVEYTYGKGGVNNLEGATLTVTLVDYGAMNGKDRAANLDIGARLYDSKVNKGWKQPTFSYKPDAQTVGFGYVTKQKDAEIRLVVAGRFDLRLTHNNTSTLKPLEACLAKINLKQLAALASK